MLKAITYLKIKSLSLLFAEILTINSFLVRINHYIKYTLIAKSETKSIWENNWTIRKKIS